LQYGCILDHTVGDACEVADELGDGFARINERGELGINAVLVELHSSNFDYGI